MQFRSFADLHDDVARGLATLPVRPDLVAGIPRSGLLAAGMASVILNVPLASTDGLARNQVFGVGKTKYRGARPGAGDAGRRVLVLDDSVSTGLSLREARAALSGLADLHDFAFAAVYGERASHPEADHVFSVVPQPRMFQWNLMHHDGLADCMLDIDGVLCPDPTNAQNDDGDAYLRFLDAAAPLLLPTKPVAALVTNRLERYRAPTEAWLARQGVRYGALHMLDAPDAAARRAMDPWAFKADVYRRSGAALFIESELEQAIGIAEAAQRPVLSVDVWRLVASDSDAYLARQAVRAMRYKTMELPRRGKIAARRLAGRLLGEEVLARLRGRGAGGPT